MEAAISPRRSVAVLLLSLLTSSLLLLPQLSTWAGDFCAWETGVLEGFAEADRADVSSLKFLADRLQLSEGLVSNSQESLLYGASTYFLFRNVGVSLAVLRVSSALFVLLGIVAAWWVIRREWGDVASAAAAVLLALSPSLTFYGRYGCSITATLLCLWLVLGAAWRYMAQPDSVLRALLLGLSFVLASLQYSPGRILALVLLGQSIAVVLFRSARQRRFSVLPVAVLLTVVGLFVGYQLSAKRLGAFSSARGEHVFQMLKEAPQILDLLGTTQDPSTLTHTQKLRFAANLVTRNLTDLRRLLVPGLRYPVFDGDPPWCPLYPLAWTPFLVVGIGLAIYESRDVRYAGLLACTGLLLATILLTNRADLHRAMVLLGPVVVFAALGLAFSIEVARRFRCPWAVLVVGGGALVAWSFHDLRASRPDGMARNAQSEAILALYRKHPGPLRLGLDVDGRYLGWGILEQLSRPQLLRPSERALIPEGVLADLQNSHPDVLSRACVSLESLLDTAAVALGPASQFTEAEKQLRRMGLRVSKVGDANLPMLLVESSSSGPPAPPPPATEQVSERALSQLEPESQFLGFGGLGKRTAYDGAPLRLRGRLFDEGLGVHAPSQLVYVVPADATVFHALVGLGDEVRACAEALAVFEVRDQDLRLLFRSRPLRATDAPVLVRVSVKGLAKIFLITNDGGNGRDCDHTVWANAAFEVAPANAEATDPRSGEPRVETPEVGLRQPGTIIRVPGR